VYWEVTRACDLACRHCRAEATPGRDRRELDTAEGLRLLQRLARFGAPLPHLVLTGGDPLKRADCFELIAAARAHGYAVSLAPSGTPLLTDDAIARLAAAGVEAISLSLDGFDAHRHDGLRGVSGCFDRTVAAAGSCRRHGLPFQLNTLVSEETHDDLSAIHRLVAGLGAARWSLFFLVGTGRGAVLRPITASACERLFAWLLDLRGHPGPVITTTEAPHFRRLALGRGGTGGEVAARERLERHGAGIRDGNGIAFISHVGAMCPSGFLPLPAGDVRTDDPVDVYRESGLFRALRWPARFGGRCGRCEWREICGGSRARAFAASGDPLAQDPLCLYEPLTAPASLARYPNVGMRGSEGGPQ
jgi:radical SAM protein